jgi:CD63 antigen
MGLNCGASLIKYVLFVFNLICAVGGIALMVVGGIALKKIVDLGHIFEEGDHPKFFPAAVLALGVIVFIIAFFGCCGAIRESQCLLNLYSLCLLIVVILQILLAIFVLVYNEDIKKGAFRGWDRLWAGNNYELNRSAIEQIQRALQCCGSQSFLDYGTILPSSCCSPDAQFCNQLTSYHVGCKTKINTIVEDSASWIAYLSIAMAAVELMGVIFGCCLSSNIRNSSRYSE